MTDIAGYPSLFGLRAMPIPGCAAVVSGCQAMSRVLRTQGDPRIMQAAQLGETPRLGGLAIVATLATMLVWQVPRGPASAVSATDERGVCALGRAAAVPRAWHQAQVG